MPSATSLAPPSAPADPPRRRRREPSAAFHAYAYRVGAAALRPPWSAAEVVRHAYVVGYRCLLPVLVSMVPFGMVIGVQGMKILDLFGAHRLLSGLMALLVIRELAPVLTSVLVAAQAGSAFAAELGAMRLKEELDATAVMAVDPVSWHVVPRVLGMALVTPALTVLAAVGGIAGGWVVAVYGRGLPHGEFAAHTVALIGTWDLWASAVKGLVYGVTIGLVSTWRGFHSSGGAEGVGRAVNDTVVICVVSILVLNYLLSTLMFTGAGAAG
ncbi:ABC transporter permease [Myxococcota bacterium]|nr:ABC transporter permease [Myxococcota bacterium]